jgi:mono/diheme cytochrome c family protein
VKRLFAIALFALGCSRGPFDRPVTLHDSTVSAETLNAGRRGFLLYCATCHGETGNGRGPSTAHMRPVPRDFSQGLFKFGGVAAGDLPTDEALLRTLRRGLRGTPMLAWDVPEHTRRDIVQYLKTLSPRWKDEAPGKPIEVSADPWKGREAEAIARGEEVYHLSASDHAGCNNCHPSYAMRAAISAMSERVTGKPRTVFSPAMYASQARDSDYALTIDAQGNPVTMQKVVPPDFLFDQTKTVFAVGDEVEGRQYTEADQREDLYRVIAAGVGGAAMPMWKGALSEENLWALAHYVQTLVQKRGSPAADELRAKLAAQP